MKTYQFTPLVVLRTPAFSYKSYNCIDLARVLNDLYFRKALLIASSAFYLQLKKKAFDFDKLTVKEKNTVQKYFNRICFRPTPFGAFATFCELPWGEGQPIKIKGKRIHINNSIISQVSAGQMVRQSRKVELLRLMSNNTIYQKADEFRYLKAVLNENNTGFDFVIASVKSIPLLRDLRRFCEAYKSYTEIIEFLADEGNLAKEQAMLLLAELIEVQLLVDDLQPTITGVDYLDLLNGKLNIKIPQSKKSSLCLREKEMSPWQGRKLDALIDHNKNTCVNTECFAVGSLSVNYQKSLMGALACMNKLVPSSNHHHLGDFISLFQKKYDGRAVPLLEVLDPEIGIGYQNLNETYRTNELTADLTVTSPIRDKAIRWSTGHQLLLEKLMTSFDVTDPKRSVLTILPADLERCTEAPGEKQISPSLSVIFRVVGNKLLIESAGGASATSLIGRFTVFNRTIKKLSDFIAQQEEAANPDVIFAEIAHISDFHTANIDRRLHCYQYEIPILAQSNLHTDRCIPLNDLWVAVVKGEIVLYSKKLGKRIIPRLSSAFNYTRNNLSVYKFLCDLQYQGCTANFQFDLSNYFPGQAYYPRVEYADTILSLATWHIKNIQVAALMNTKEREKIQLFRTLAKELSLPQWIALTSGDHQLIFDIADDADVVFFLETIKNNNSSMIKEFIYPPDQQQHFLSDGTAPMIGQFIASVYTDAKRYVDYPVYISEEKYVKRKIMPGEEWLYFKIYCHVSTANELLKLKINPLMELLLHETAVAEWYYVRFTDPHYHLRIRVKVLPGKFSSVVTMLTGRFNQLVKKQLIHHYTIDIYEREIERYRADRIQQVEHLFCLSTAVAIKKILFERIKQDDQSYCMFALLSVKMTLASFKLFGKERIVYLEHVVRAFLTEFSSQVKLTVQLDTKYRAYQKMIDLHMQNEVAYFKPPALKQAQDVFQAGVNYFYDEIKRDHYDNFMKTVADIIHMHLNRILTDDFRMQELILYYFLLKYERKACACAPVIS